MIEKQINHSVAFLDVYLINNQNLTLQAYHKSTYTGLLLNFKSFTSFSYKISLIKCLIDRLFKICNSWNSFHNDIENIKSNLIKNAYPSFLIDKVIKSTSIISFLVTDINQKTHLTLITLNYHISATFHTISKINLRNFAKSCVKKILVLVFSSFKIKNYFSYKDPILDDLKSFLVYKFTCTSCSSSYIGKTCHPFKTRIEENIKKDNKSHIFKHLHSTTTCLTHIILFVLK